MRLNNSKQQLISCKLLRRRRRKTKPTMQCLLSILSSFIILTTTIKHNNFLVFVTSFQLQHPSLSLQHTNYNNNHDRIRRKRRRPTILLNELPTPSSKYLDRLCDVGVRFLFFCVMCVTIIVCIERGKCV